MLKHAGEGNSYFFGDGGGNFTAITGLSSFLLRFNLFIEAALKFEGDL